MAKRITIIQGHPDAQIRHFGHALADSYADGAEEAGHEVKRITVAELDFPILRRKEDFEINLPPPSLRPSQEAIGSADHLVVFYPLWLGTMPAILKAFLEQVFRPGFAFSEPKSGKMWKKLLKGKTARIIVTMGMPALIYRWYFGAHSLRSLERNILAFSGIGPIKSSLIGMVEAIDDAKRDEWIAKMRRLGYKAY